MKAGSSPCAACEKILHPKTGFTQRCHWPLNRTIPPTHIIVILANQFPSSNKNATGEISGTILDWRNIHPKNTQPSKSHKKKQQQKILPQITVDFSNVSFLSFKGTTRKKPTASPLKKVGRNPPGRNGWVKTPRLEGLLISLIHMGFVTLQPFLVPLRLKGGSCGGSNDCFPPPFFLGMNIL